MHILIWIFGIIATYRLWEGAKWLPILVIVLTLSYQVNPEEQHQQDKTGKFDGTTAARLMWTFILVTGIFIYSLLK